MNPLPCASLGFLERRGGRKRGVHGQREGPGCIRHGAGGAFRSSPHSTQFIYQVLTTKAIPRLHPASIRLCRTRVHKSFIETNCSI